MSDIKTKSQVQDGEAIRARTEEMERKVKAEGLDLNHPQGKERFEELLDGPRSPRNKIMALRGSVGQAINNAASNGTLQIQPPGTTPLPASTSDSNGASWPINPAPSFWQQHEVAIVALGVVAALVIWFVAVQILQHEPKPKQ